MAIIDERRDAENIIANGDVGASPTKTCYLIGKYFFSIGKNKVQVRDEIHNFLDTHYKKYNKVKWDNRLDDIVNQLSKRKCEMVYVEKLVFTDKEMDKIESLPSERLKKMAFIILYRAKLTKAMYGKDDVWLSDGVGYISRLAGVRGKTDEKMIMLSKLQDFGFIKQSQSVKHFVYHVLFIEDGEDVLCINKIIDEKEIINYYKMHLGMNIIKCKECGILIEPKSKYANTIYCDECSKKIKNIQNKGYSCYNLKS